ncbi:hypothetical protein PPERSA_07055 [Pseudocohnilembus persalinus]|uniref:Uncharacterized protein n=1 Tax=Pseudocohnilembus persalinus TaxID=266149 RepID=A0A0V0QAN1_PSEPJ|nr:hypothetical protein PPERSA_07055 [Pseudocohnilembus persalinus]|eukprot:KRW99283.1 hypothetical protein PPERSA_07055 [Pseudocohnilembus persalinus]
MAEQNQLLCKKKDHLQLKYIFFNYSSDQMENLFYCPICITQEQFQKQNGYQQNKNVLGIELIQNLELKQDKIAGWPPIKDKPNQKIYQDSKIFLKDYGFKYSSILNNLKEKIMNFYDDFQLKINTQIQNQKKDTIIQLEKYCQNIFTSQNQETEQNKVQELISKFDIQILREKLQEFEKSKVNINKLYQFKQEQNEEIFNNAEIFSSLADQLEKIKEINQELQKQFTKIQELILPFENFKINLDIVNQNSIQKLFNFYKNSYNNQNNSNNFEVENDNRIIKFNNNNYSCIYSENLRKDKKYHLQFKIDFKNHVQNMLLHFSLTSEKDKETKDLYKENVITIFNQQNQSEATGGEFQKQGKEFYEFFNDNQTIINLVFNIQEKYMELYDDEKVSYQRLSLKSENIENWILGIMYCQPDTMELPTIIEFLQQQIFYI